MSETPYRIGVHVAHCCKDHGCKYGDAQCPVYGGNAAQGYPCEQCDELDITITKVEYDRLKNDSRFLAALEAHGVDNWEGWDDVIQMFGRKARSSGAIDPVVVEIPPKPNMPELRTWNVSWGFGNEVLVQAHYAKRIDGEMVFATVKDYEWIQRQPGSVLGCSFWRSITCTVFQASGYIYVQEVDNG